MRTAELTERLAAGESIALITDAGMPGLSDPGARRHPRVHRTGVAVHRGAWGLGDYHWARRLRIIDGAVLLPRISPGEGGQRQRELAAAAERVETTVFFESPYRINKTLAACAALIRTGRSA